MNTINALFILVGVSQSVILMVSLKILFKHKGTDLKAFCGGKEIDLTAWFELESLVDQLNQLDAPYCDEYYRQALVDLLEIYTEDKSDICTTKKAWMIENYYKIYLKFPNAPESLKNFLIVYGLQVSGHCKLNMINTFMEDAKHLLTDNDFLELAEWIDKNGPIDNLFNAIVYPGEIVLPIDLFAALPNGMLRDKLVVQVTKSGRIRRAKEVCSKRFMPIYRPVAGPVVALMHAGFDYSKLLDRNDDKTNIYINDELNKWARIIFLCETLDALEVVLNPNGEESINFLSKQEMAVLDRKMKNQVDNDLFGGDASLKRVVLPPSRGVRVDNVLVPPDLNRINLVPVIDSIKTGNEKLRLRLLKKSWSLMRTRFKHGEYKRLFKTAFRMAAIKWKSRDTDITDEKMDLIRSELVEALEAKDDSLLYKILTTSANFIKKYLTAIVGFTLVM